MRRYLTGLLAALLLLCTAAGAVDGAGQNEPLALSASSVADGAANVAVDTSIRLDFTKNVVNLQVKDNNMTCFSVTDSQENQVPIVVYMGDDQVDREVRNTIYVSPVQAWPAGEKLTLTISENLTAKSGATMGRATALRFTTAGAAAVPTPTAAVTTMPEPEAAPTPVPTPTPTPAESELLLMEPPAAESAPAAVETETPVPSPTAVPSEPPAQTDADGGIPAAVILAVVLIAAAAAAVLLVARSRGSRK